MCLLCSTPLNPAAWHRNGGALGTADLPPKKRPDVVDPLVAITAARHGSAVVFTSDPDDISAYPSALNAQGVRLVAVLTTGQCVRGRAFSGRTTGEMWRPSGSAVALSRLLTVREAWLLAIYDFAY